MRKKPVDPHEMFRSVLQAQVDIEDSEMILDRPGLLNVNSIKEMNMTIKQNTTTSTREIAQPTYESMEAHCAAINQCQLCTLGKTRNKFVYGVGNVNADVMFVGEAPGANEDLKGEPFVGRGGELLDRILAAIQFTRQDVYIANILKCRPPNNRDPQPDEMEKCFPYLHEQIRLIRPKLICALGRIAAQALHGSSTPLGKLRGVWHEYEGVPMIVTYHPAALLRFAAYKRDTWADMQMLKARYDSMK